MSVQIGYFDSFKSVAGKVLTYLASITLAGTDGKTITCTQDTTLDEAVAMSSKALKTDTINGDGVAGRQERAFALQIQPGATPNTDINITNQSAVYTAFNPPTISNATNLAASGTSGSFSLSADGTVITMNLTPNFIGVKSVSYMTQKINSAGTPPYYTIGIISGGNLTLYIMPHGANSSVDWRTVMDAGDFYTVLISCIFDS